MNKISEMLLTELTKAQLINKSRNDPDINYNPMNREKGKNRYERRRFSRVSRSVQEYNQMDMNTLFKQDILTVNIKVQGETDTYVVIIKFGGILKELQREVKNNNNQLEFKQIHRALMTVFNSGDVFMRCSCPDFCLHEDTSIKLLNGEHITVKEMLERCKAGEELWVYSTDAKGDFKPGKVSDVWISGYENDMVKVTLDNGEEIITTPNHRYMLRDGSYEEAQNLREGQSLMPLYFRYDNGYESYKKNSDPHTAYYSVYKEVANSELQTQIEEAKIRSGEDIIAIHHKDYNKLNNYPSNLYPMGKLEHYTWHYQHTKESGNWDKCRAGSETYWATEEARTKQAKVMSEVITNYYANRTPEEIERDAQNRRNNTLQSWAKGCFDTEAFHTAAMKRGEFLKAPETREASKEGIKKYWTNLTDEAREVREVAMLSNLEKAHQRNRGSHQSEELKAKRSFNRLHESEEKKAQRTLKSRDRKLTNVINRMLSEGLELNPTNYEQCRGSMPKWDKYFERFEDLINYFDLAVDYNHKIVKVEHIHYDEPIPVYDISVEKYNNFLVSAGVVLHNCYRFDHWSFKNDYAIEKTNYAHFNDPGPGKGITNPKDTRGAGCKHLLLVLANVDWLMKVASTINNYIHYMEEHYERLYADIMFPKIYGMPYEAAIQLDIFDNQRDYLKTSKDVLSKANVAGKERTQFKKGNKQGMRFTANDDEDEDQLQLDLDGEVTPEEEEVNIRAEVNEE